MSMSTNVVGFKPPDAKWKKMKAIWDACHDGETDPPKDVRDFFNGEDPDDAGVRVEIEETPCCKEYNAEMVSGFDIDITKLPKDVTIIRLYNSW